MPRKRPAEAHDLDVLGAVDPEESRARARVEDPEWLATLKALATARAYSVTRTHARMLGITRRRAQDHVTAALKRQTKRGGAPAEVKRAVLVAKAEEAYRVAMDHHKPLTVGIGIGLSRVEMWPEPNEAAALKAIDTIARLDGLLEPDKLSVTVGGTVDVQVMAAMQRAYGMLPAVVDEQAEPAPRALPEGEGEDEKQG